MTTALALSAFLAVVAGGAVGFALRIVGGGGSLLGVPLLLYVVGAPSPHVAIGTSAAAVGLNAAYGLLAGRTMARIKWRCALVFAGAGIAGAAIGSSIGKAVDGHHLLAVLAAVMVAVAASMLLRRNAPGNPAVRLAAENFLKLVAFGFATGAVSGIFGIGGGFLIAPALVAATGMPIASAVASSLVPVLAFSLTTAANYQLSGLVDWPLAALFAVGGILGGGLAARPAAHLSARPAMLNALFAGLIVAAALVMFAESLA
ncbi:MAG: sulfite exporter TauE/SafE family protein [Bauldia sp.]